jgi:hypothetical protein
MAVVELERYRHEEPAFTIDLPAGAEVGVMPGVLVVARAPEGVTPSPFRTNLTVVAQELGPDMSPEKYAAGALAEAAASFPGWRLIDRTPVEIGGLRGERTLATYVLQRDSGVDFGREMSAAVEQWRLAGAGLAWIVSASCEAAEYGMVGSVWRTSAETLRTGDAA